MGVSPIAITFSLFSSLSTQYIHTGSACACRVGWPLASLLSPSVQHRLTVRSILHSGPLASPHLNFLVHPWSHRRAQLLSMAFKTLHTLVPPHPASLISLCSLTRKFLSVPLAPAFPHNRAFPCFLPKYIFAQTIPSPRISFFPLSPDRLNSFLPSSPNPAFSFFLPFFFFNYFI